MSKILEECENGVTVTILANKYGVAKSAIRFQRILEAIALNLWKKSFINDFLIKDSKVAY